MPAARKARPPVQDLIQAELQLIRASVAGVHGSLAATTDGLLVAGGSELAEGVQDPGQHLRRWRLVVGLTRRQLRCLRGLR